ncbi:MAG: histidine kinase dimerization/phospho-acceptor domain-containing protein [Gemmatimonadaceae bacterium]
MTVAGAALLWAGAIQGLADRAAHEIRSPLNGAALNIAVVRSRLERAGTDPSTLSPFAEAASEELDRAIGLVEAILALARSAPIPVDLYSTLSALVSVMRVIARSEGGEVSLERTDEESTQTSLEGNAVRGALALALSAAVAGGARVRCRVGRSGERIAIQIMSGVGDALSEDASQAIRKAGIGVERESAGTTLLFSRAQAGSEI